MKITSSLVWINGIAARVSAANRARWKESSEGRNVAEAIKENKTVKAIIGEVLGTFMMCFFGIGAVATATLYGAHTGPFQVGMVWGITIAIAIYVTRNLSCAHFNPAVTFAMCVSKRLPWKEFPVYVISQLVGAVIAAALLWVFFADSVAANLVATGATMSDPAVAGSAASIWIEVFPNTGAGVITPFVGALAEGVGVFLLVLVIFSMTEDCNVGRPNDNLFPLFIGLTVTMIICVVGPMTDAGLNPARDLGPRIVAALVGFGNACSLNDILVYTVAPLIGGGLAAILFTQFIEKQHKAVPAEK